MRDLGHEETERLIRQMEREVAKVYQQAASETKEKLDDYLRRFEIKDEKWKLMVESGERTEAQYKAWRRQQIMVGERWAALQNSLASDYHHSNLVARKIVTGYRAEAYAANMNYATFLVELGVKADTAFTLYNREAVERILRDKPDLLPPPGKQMKRTLKANPDIAWQKGQIQSVTMQSVLQGDSIPDMGKRIARTMGEINHRSTIRYARTAMTGAQNAGRVDAHHRAAELGIELSEYWVSTLDERTRFEHRLLDGQKKELDEPFEVNGYTIRYPGDPNAEPEMIWNCRCTMRAFTSGWKPGFERRSTVDIDGDYEDWKNNHQSISHSITKQEEIGEAMKWRTIREDYNG